MKKQLWALLLFVPLFISAQVEKTVDENVMIQTRLNGETGLSKTEIQENASQKKIEALLANFQYQNFLLFPEVREKSIRMLDGIPSVWAKRNKEQLESIELTAQPGEYFVFQIGVWAARKDLEMIKWTSSKFTGSSDLGDLTCFNIEGINLYGNKFSKEINIKKGEVQPLWFGIQIPKNAKGLYSTKIMIGTKNDKMIPVLIKINVDGSIVENNGFDDANRFSRMAWLNTILGESQEVTKGYSPIELKKQGFMILGREVKIADNGLPLSIDSYFDNNNQSLIKTPQAILKGGFRFVVELANGKIISFQPEKLKFITSTTSRLVWKVLNRAAEAELEVTGKAEFDGFVGYQIRLISKKRLDVKDIRMEIPLTSNMSKYMMGMDKEGGLRPTLWSWKWDVGTKGQDDIWIGGVNGGLRIKLKDENYRRELVNAYYSFCPLLLPKSWGNDNKGGAKIESQTNGTLFSAFSGNRKMAANQELFFNCELLITPLKIINKNIQYNDRYYHSDKDVSTSFIPEAERGGANIINIHHKKDIYPFINYPYLPENVAPLSKFIDDAHKKNIRTKVYYTTREITVNTPEIWALRSLNGEIIFPGPGKDAKTVVNPNGPHQWLIDNFKGGFIPAWKCGFQEGPYKGRQDLSVITTPDSRMNNFYLNGLDWMCKNMKIDGVYIDDSALDRETIRRARRILDANRPNARIDLHAWNSFNEMGGFICSLNLYMDLLPYLDMLWIGEGRDYSASPDYWLVETAGIPFGMTSQMLKNGGNKWRGMVFGMTNRFGWQGSSPEYIWKFWDEQKIQEMDMIGFWDQNCAIKSDNKDMIVTLYKGKNKAIIAVANWTKDDVSGKLYIDWSKLGLDPKKVKLKIPFIQEYQAEKNFVDGDIINIEGEKGFLIVIE